MAKRLYLGMPNKKTLRSLYRAKRQALSATALEQASEAILEKVIRQTLVPEGLLMLFFDSPQHHEVPMQKWFERFESTPICVPKVVDSNGRMEAVLWQKEMTLVPNSWGILEPESNTFINPKKITSIIVPLLCFDQNGQRVGYGKGYYDRFLARCDENVNTIGVSVFDAVQKIEDVTPEDVALHMAVTPKKVCLF